MAGSSSLVTAAYLAVPALSLLTAALLAGYIYRFHRGERGSTSFLLILGMGLVWIGVLFLHVLLSDPAVLLPLATVELAAALVAFALFTLFVSRYTGTGYHRSRVYQVAFAAIVAGFPALALTNSWHGLVYRDYRIATAPFTYVAFDHGLGWVLGISLACVMAGYSSYVLAQHLLSSAGRTGMQLVMMLVAVLSIGFAEALGRTGLLPATEFHHGAYGTLPWVVLMTFALFRFQLFDMQPVARNVVVETLQDPVVVLDSDRRIADANAQAARVWPSIEDSVGDQFADVCPFVAEAIDLPTTEPRTTSRITLPVEDEQRHYSIQVSTVRQGRGETADWYAIVLRDVTELEQSRWQLEKQNERLDQVAATISHDLRNPITVADGYIEVVREDFLADTDVDPARVEQAREYLETAGGSLARMEQIIDDVLTLAREGKSVEETERLDLETIADEAWTNVDTDAATLRVHESRAVEADRGRLLTIFENLFRNTLDHGPPDVTVELGTTEQGFYVADDGPGISTERRDDVFEYGFTTDDDGTGLGLSIVRTMAESHGWTVSVDPEYEDGAWFEFDTTSMDADRDRARIPTTLEPDG